jgi:hypothetical protein
MDQELLTLVPGSDSQINDFVSAVSDLLQVAQDVNDPRGLGSSGESGS